MTRSLIERWFPAPVIGAESLRERGASSALPPVNFLHVWWARRPLTGSRAALVASLLPAWPTDDDIDADPDLSLVQAALEEEFPEGEAAYREWYLTALGILGDPVRGRALIKAANELGKQLDGNGYGYPRAFTASPSTEDLARFHRLAALRASTSDPPLVIDPFAGGGSIPFECARYGCEAVAVELNPVASAVLEGTVVQPGTLGPAFAATIQTYGTRWAAQVEQQLDEFFPRAAGEGIVGYIWATTVPCPSTGLPTPLAPDLWLARGKAGKSIAVRLDVDRAAESVTTVVVHDAEAEQYGPRSTYKRGTGVSIWTEETFSGDYIRERATAGEAGAMLLAVCVNLPGKTGRHFRAPTVGDAEAVRRASEALEAQRARWEIDDLMPSEEIFEGKETERSVRMGLRHWRDMFVDRQLLANVTALEALREVQAEARAELPESEARAVALYLSLALDKAVDYNGRLSSWDATRIKVRNTFDRHDFAFKWTFAEFDAAHNLIPWAVSQVVDAYAGIAKLAVLEESLTSGERRASARVIRGSATHLLLEDGSVDAVITDPPYYDNVMYGECSDYFYVWLKRALRDSWPEFTDLPVSDKQDEAVANPSLFKAVATFSGRGRQPPGTKSAAQLADAHYEQLLTEAFRETHRVLKDDGVMTVMFTHKRVDAWDTLGAALLTGGFTITSSWPVHTESEHSLHQAKKNAATSTIFLACEKRQGTQEAYWEDIRGDVATAAREAAARFAEQGITGVDLTLATYGPALEVLSQRWPVYTGELGSDGEPELLRPDRALDLAREEVARLKKRSLLGGRAVEFDRLTDYYLLAWNDFRAAEFPSGEALKLSIATHLDLDELIRPHRLLQSSAGWVRLLTPAERRTAGGIDPEHLSPPAMIDGLQSLMLVYEEDGLNAARAWLQNAGLRDDARFRDLVRSALAAVPRTKQGDEFVRPEARALEGLRRTLFDDIPAPVDPHAVTLEHLQQELELEV